MTDASAIQTPRHSIGVAMVLLACTFIALMPIGAKLAYREGADTLAVVTFRSVFGLVGLGLYMVARGQTFRVGWPAFRYSAWTGLAQVAASFGFMGAVAYIDVSLAILIVFFHPFVIAFIGHVRGAHRLSGSQFGYIALALGGLALTLGVSLEGINGTGVCLALLGMAGTTAMLLMVYRITQEVGVMPASFYMTAWCLGYFALAALIGPALGLFEPMDLPQAPIGWAGLIGAGATLSVGYLLYFGGANLIGPTRASVLSIIEPVLTILFAIALVGEWFSAVQWLGVMCVVGALVLMERPMKRAP